jgi:flagellar protein FliO/FliZ
MYLKITLCWFLLSWLSTSFAVILDTASPKQAVRTVSPGDIASWGVGLVVVLGVFFLCAWWVRKLSGMTVNGNEKIRMVGGLSLGMREKVILLQVGKKQLMLGVTPGRIETLLVLEGDDCLQREEQATTTAGSGFAQKLVQALKAHPDA